MKVRHLINKSNKKELLSNKISDAQNNLNKTSNWNVETKKDNIRNKIQVEEENSKVVFI